MLVVLLILATIVLVVLDVQHIEEQNDDLGGVFPWLLGLALMWIFVFPYYIVKRNTLIEESTKVLLPTPVAWVSYAAVVGLLGWTMFAGKELTLKMPSIGSEVRLSQEMDAPNGNPIAALVSGSSACMGDDVNGRLIEKAEPLVYIGNVPVFGTRHSADTQKQAMAVLMLMASGDAQILYARRRELEKAKDAALGAPALVAALKAVPTVEQRCNREISEHVQIAAEVEAMKSEDEATCNTRKGYSGWLAEDLLCVAQRRLSQEKIVELEQTTSCQPQYTMFKHRLKSLKGDCVFAALEAHYQSIEEPAKSRLGECQLTAKTSIEQERQAITTSVIGEIESEQRQLNMQMDGILASAAESYTVELRNVQLVEKNEETRKVRCSAEVYGTLRDRANATMKLGAVDYSIQRPDGRNVLVSMTRNYEMADQEAILRLVAEAASAVE